MGAGSRLRAKGGSCLCSFPVMCPKLASTKAGREAGTPWHRAATWPRSSGARGGGCPKTAPTGDLTLQLQGGGAHLGNPEQGRQAGCSITSQAA